MAAVIDATVGGPAANAYVTSAECDAYHEAHVSGAVWAAATSDEKIRAIITATRQLDAYMEWAGFAASSTQALAFPRTGLVDPSNGREVLGTEIPTRLKSAACEQARSLLAGDRTTELEQQRQGIRSLQAGSVAIEFETSSSAAPQTLASSALAFVACWGIVKQPGRGGNVPLLRI